VYTVAVNCSSGSKERKSKDEKCDTLVRQKTFDKRKFDTCKLKGLIITQLIAASPASLPFDIVMHGLDCWDKTITVDKARAVLRELVDSNLIVKISECGFGDRYGLVDDYFPIMTKDDE
jgi:hypothetical protein